MDNNRTQIVLHAHWEMRELQVGATGSSNNYEAKALDANPPT